MIPSAANPLLRPEIAAMLDAEAFTRQARRLLADDITRGAEARPHVTKLLDDAIAQLVSARSHIAPISENTDA